MAKKINYKKIETNGLAYVGQSGNHLSGIPARDLTPEYVRHLSTKQIDLCIESELYIIPDKPIKTAPVEQPPAKENNES